MSSTYISLDGLRGILVLIFAVSQCVMAFWPDRRKWPNTTATRSAALDTPIVPVSGTFAIWGLIFASSIAFAVWQILPDNVAHPMAQQIGWIAIVVFAANTAWEYIVPKYGMGWSSVALAIVEFVGLGLILIFLSWGSWALTGVQWWLVAAPFHLFAGWVTAAVFVNLSSALRAKGFSVGNSLGLVLLVPTGLIAVSIAWASGAIIYAAVVIWALGGITLAARRTGGRTSILATSIVLAVGLCVATLLAARPVSAPAPLAGAAPEVETAMVSTEDLDIHYLAWGPEDGPAVIAFHGWPDDAASWTEMGEALGARGYRVYAPYLRGFGPTAFRDADTIRSGQLAALVSDGFAFADALGLDGYTLIGHDWGGRIAQSMAVLEPDRVEGLLSLSSYSISYTVAPPPPIGFVPQLWYQFALNMPAGAANLETDRDGFLYAIWSRWTPSWDEDARRSAFQAARTSFDNPDFNEITLSAYSYTGWGQDPRYAELEARLAAGPMITVPVMIVQGADDPLERPEISAAFDAEQFMGGIARHVIAGAGHWPHREAPEELVQLFFGTDDG